MRKLGVLVLAILAGLAISPAEAANPNFSSGLSPFLPGSAATTITVAQNPAGQASATFVMAGLDSGGLAQITPTQTGRVLIQITGTVANGTISDGANIKIMIAPAATASCVNSTGTSSGLACLTAPSNNAAVVGTQCGGVEQYVNAAAAAVAPFNLSCILTGLQLGAPVWYDVAFQQVTGGTVTLTNVAAVAVEF